jgi:hypothetical protein
MRFEDYANCVQCGQARLRRVLNLDGVCPWCTLTVILCASNPVFEEER